MRKTTALLLLSLFISIAAVHSQDHTVKVWPDDVPGSINDPGYQEEITTGRDGRNRIRQVTDPTIEVFLPAKESVSGSAVIICPGGGYRHLAIEHEGYDVARWLNTKGIAGIVLKYRLPSDVIMEDQSVGPLQDAQEAIRIVRRRAGDWNIDPQKIGIMGFSAGGHLVTTASTLFEMNVYEPTDQTSARPDFAISVYGAISIELRLQDRPGHSLLGEDSTPDVVRLFSAEYQVRKETPPTFIVHSLDDPGVDIENSIRYLQALKSKEIPAELHIYERGGHGYGLGRGAGTESNWTEACLQWLRMKGFL